MIPSAIPATCSFTGRCSRGVGDGGAVKGRAGAA